MDEDEDTETAATDPAPSRVPVLEHLVPGLVLGNPTDAGVDPQATRLCATVIHSVEEDSVVVVLREGSVTITTVLYALVPVLVPPLVVVERDHFFPGGARLAITEVDMAAGESQGVTPYARVGHVRGHSLDRNRFLALGHFRLIRDTHEAGVAPGPSAGEGEPRAEASAEKTSGTAGQGRQSRYFISIGFKNSDCCAQYILCSYSRL